MKFINNTKSETALPVKNLAILRTFDGTGPGDIKIYFETPKTKMPITILIEQIDEIKLAAVMNLAPKQPRLNKIWCVFSVRNEYDQPEFNLEFWYTEKPSFEDFCVNFGVDVDPALNVFQIVKKYGELVNDLRKIYEGRELGLDGTTYRFREVVEKTATYKQENRPS